MPRACLRCGPISSHVAVFYQVDWTLGWAASGLTAGQRILPLDWLQEMLQRPSFSCFLKTPPLPQKTSAGGCGTSHCHASNLRTNALFNNTCSTAPESCPISSPPPPPRDGHTSSGSWSTLTLPLLQSRWFVVMRAAESMWIPLTFKNLFTVIRKACQIPASHLAAASKLRHYKNTPTFCFLCLGCKV